MAFFGLLGRGNTTADATIKVNYDGKKAIDGLKKLKGSVNGVITALALRQIARYAAMFSELGATVQLVNKNFAKFASDRGRQTNDMMRDLKRATLGMVDDLALQQQAMKAMIGGVSFDDMITSMEFVTKFALATGSDVNQKMTTVMTGLARKSAMFLDDVGIQVMGASDVVGAAVEQMKEKMGQFATSIDDPAVKMAQFKANLKTFKQDIGQYFIEPLNLAVTAANKFFEVTKKPENLREIDKKIKDTESLLQKLYLELGNGPSNFEKFADGVAKAFGEKGLIQNEEDIKKTISFIESSLKAAKETRQKILNEGLTDEQVIENKRSANRDAILKKQIERNKELKDSNKNTTKDEAKEQEKLRIKIQEELDRRIEAREDAEEHMAKLTKDIRDRQLQERQAEELKNIENREMAIDRANAIIGRTSEQARQEMLDQLESDLQDDLITRETYHRAVLKLSEDAAEEEKAIRKQSAEDAKSIAISTANALSAFNNILLSDELSSLNISAKNREEYEKKKAEIMRDAARREQAIAIFRQGVALAESIANTAEAVTSAASHGASVGGIIGLVASGAAALSAMVGFIASIGSATVPDPPSFQTGRMGNKKRGRNGDRFIMVDEGEAIISAPQAAMHEPILSAIANNTANLRNFSGGGQTINYIGVSTEQMLQSQVSIQRKNKTGRRI